MTKYFGKTSVIMLMVVGAALLTEIAFLNWSFTDRVAAKCLVWALVIILANHVQQGKMTFLRFQRQ